jgi:hypothetical protein
MRSLLPFLLILCFVGRTSQGQTIKVDVDLTLVNATVRDRHGCRVPGLSAENFKLWEDKVEQKIEYFSAEDAPVSVGVILDISGSMQRASAAVRNAAVPFLENGNRDEESSLWNSMNDPPWPRIFRQTSSRKLYLIAKLVSPGPKATLEPAAGAVAIAITGLSIPISTDEIGRNRGVTPPCSVAVLDRQPVAAISFLESQSGMTDFSLVFWKSH